MVIHGPRPDAVRKNEGSVAPIFCEILAREVLKSANLIGPWNIKGEGLQGNIAADPRSME